MHTVFALLCFVVVIHWLILPNPSGLLHWHCGNLMIAPVPAKQPWWIWINTSCWFIMNDCITTIKQSTTKPCAYFLGYTVCYQQAIVLIDIDCLMNRHPWIGHEIRGRSINIQGNIFMLCVTLIPIAEYSHTWNGNKVRAINWQHVLIVNTYSQNSRIKSNLQFGNVKVAFLLSWSPFCYQATEILSLYSPFQKF